MNKTLIIFFIFILTNFFTIFSTFDCKKKTQKIVEKIEIIENNLNKKNVDFLIKETKNLNALWKKLEKSLRIYLKRKNLEEVGKKLATLEQNIKFLKIYDAKKSIYHQYIKLKEFVMKLLKKLNPQYLIYYNKYVFL